MRIKDSRAFLAWMRDEVSYYERMGKAGGGGEVFRHLMNDMTLYVPYLIDG
jgi:hypothetical protein